MRILRDIGKAKSVLHRIRSKGYSLGFVPTMGALHEGHASLIRAARKENDYTVVSIFVNPIQFGKGEDYARYPRPVRDDFTLCRRLGVDYVLFPKTKAVFPSGFRTFVTVEGLSQGLCALHRPGHFTGVATVVTMLFNIVGPDNAYFGQKDAQQAVIIRKMVKDLHIPVEINVMPTVRENTGLALSSRNRYLSEGEKEDALVISEALQLAKALVKKGNRDAGRIKTLLSGLIRSKKTATIDYIEIVDPKSLKPLKRIKGRCLLALAVRIGKTRLIDNTILP